MRWLGMFIPGVAWAENVPVHLPGIENLMTTLLALSAILAVIFILAAVIKRFGGLPLTGSGFIRVLGGVSLGARERVVVVEVAGTRLVLGVAPGRVQTLYVIPKNDALKSERIPSIRLD